VKKILPESEPPRPAATDPAGALPQKGSVHLQRRRCGRPTCRCTRGRPHPAHYLFWWEGGKLKKRYLRASEVEPTGAACRERLRREAEAREAREAVRRARREWRALITMIREVEQHD
jgi:hypothetical protein